jgi:hypothetical protein
LIFRIAIFDRDVLALDEACFLQSLLKRSTKVLERLERRAAEEPTTGSAGCARIGNGHATAAPPNNMMASRRFINDLHLTDWKSAPPSHFVSNSLDVH